MHSYLDSHNKLGLDEEWANDVSRGDGLMPDYESLAGVYKRLGWIKQENGRVIAPDQAKMEAKQKRSRQRKAAQCQASRAPSSKAPSVATGTARSMSDPTLLPAALLQLHGSQAKQAVSSSKQSLPRQNLPCRSCRALPNTEPNVKDGAPLSPRTWPEPMDKNTMHYTHTSHMSAAVQGNSATAIRPSSAPAIRQKPLRASQRERPSAPIRGAYHLVRPETAQVHSVMSRCASAPRSRDPR